jgi:hypothetical protein
MTTVAHSAQGWMFRWDMTSDPRADAFGYAYMVNRWTGTVHLLHGLKMVEVQSDK